MNHRLWSTSHTSGWLALVLVIWGALVYVNSLDGVFLFDDLPHIVDEPSIETLSWPWSGRLKNRPFLQLSLAVNYAWGGRRTNGYHLVNMAIHITAALLLFGIIRRTLSAPVLPGRGPTNGTWLAFAVALLWMVHPLQTQGVTYIIQRGESLMGWFYLATLYCTIRCAEGLRNSFWAALGVIMCALGMGTKEVMVTAPVVALLWDRTFYSGSLAEAWRRRWFFYLGLFATWIVLLAILGPARPFRGKSMGFGIESISVTEYVVTQPSVILHYLRLSLWPLPLCLDYSWLSTESMTQFVLPALLIGLALGSTVWAIFHQPWLGFLMACFFLVLSPTSSIVPIQDLAVEHRMYLPLAVVITLAVLLGNRIVVCQSGIGRGLSLALILLLGTLLSYQTWSRHYDYHSREAIWRSVVNVAPNNARGQYNYASALRDQGRLSEAVGHYQAAITLDPEDHQSHNNLASTLLAQGKIDEAITHLHWALSVNKDDVLAYINLGTALVHTGRSAEAIEPLEQALKLNPRSAIAHYNLGHIRQLQGHREEAKRCFDAALKANPHLVEAHSQQAQLAREEGQLELATEHLWAMLRIDINASTYNRLGILLALQGQLQEGIVQYYKALDIKPDFAEAHYNLASVLEEQGRLDQAVNHLSHALASKPQWAQAHHQLGLILEMQGRLHQSWESFRRTATLKPGWATAHRNAARVLLELGQIAPAMNAIRKSLQLKPRHPQTEYRLATALFEQGHLEDAIEHYRLALRIQPNFAAAHRQLALVLVKIGFLGEARKHQAAAEALRAKGQPH